MNSKDLADLAGVTVRTLRHYHQVGILPEPPRSDNGYRNYSVHDLIRVLRIRRLAALGIPLDQMPAILDTAEQSASTELLEELDHEIESQIDRLTRQRALIAQVRAERSAPDLPPELARFLAVFSQAGVSPALTEIDRDHSILLAHIVGEEGISQLASVYDRFTQPDHFPAIIELARRFDELNDMSSDAAIESLVDYFFVAFAPLIEGFSDSEVLADSRTADLLDSYHHDRLNTAQRSFLERVTARFE